MLKQLKLKYYVLLVSFINLLLYQYPFFKFVLTTSNTKSFNGIILLISLIIASIVLNAFVFYIGLYILRNVGKWLLAIFFNISAIAVYFINTYGVIIDRHMIGNVINTNYEESSSFLSLGLLLYILFLGLLPSFFLFKFEIIRPQLKHFLISTVLTLLFLGVLVFANSSNWLWIDKNSKTLGGLVMPWSYVVNTSRYYNHINKKNKKQILLPNATIKNDEKSIAVLVIGESARSSNFSLYGYEKNTNPLLSQIEGLKHFEAESCATYTTAGLQCILEHQDTGKLYEILPNYLFRNGVDVIWKTTNWGEPKVTIDNFQNKGILRKNCDGKNCDFDGILLKGLKDEILASKKNKILIVLHTSTSHGPTYYKKYPKEFERFTPVCKSVELADCTQQELVNAYDNTILYTDYLVASLIEDLKELTAYNTSMMYISDHGESLGEKGLYMHGIPSSLAPKEQLEIPFIAWTSEGSKTIKENQEHSQHNIFHSVLDFLAVDSPIYDEAMSIYK
jgi:lipid A ethanolaminephosphotransferase